MRPAIADAAYKPCAHGRAQKNQRNGKNGDQQTGHSGGYKIRHFNAFLIIGKSCKGTLKKLEDICMLFN